MFSSFHYLKRKTPEQGINRKEYIEHLVEEYYTTTDVEAQEQVTANLANFAYDPLNWDYLKTAKVLQLFIELLETPNESLQLHGLAGLCNICLDQSAFNFIIKFENIKTIKEFFINSKNVDAILNLLTLFYHLLSQTNSVKTEILCPAVLKQITYYNFHHTSDKRILNLTSLLLEEFGKRYEYYEATKSTHNTPFKFTQQDLDTFSKLTGDLNYVHSSDIPKEKRKVHGAFLNSIVTGALGTQYPGTIVLEQTFSFPKPCRLEVDCEFLLKFQQKRKISIISYECKQNNDIVFKGEAKLLITNKN